MSKRHWATLEVLLVVGCAQLPQEEPATELVLPPHARAPMQLSHRGIGIRVTETSCTASPGRPIDAALVPLLAGFKEQLPQVGQWHHYPATYPAGHSLLLVDPQGQPEQFISLAQPGPREIRYLIERQGEAARFALTPIGSLEVQGKDGNAYLRMAPPFLYTRRGEKRPMAVRVNGVAVDPRVPIHFVAPQIEVTLAVAVADADYPILIDPSWQSTASMNAARMEDALSILLPSGKVLVVGGRDSTGPLSSTEIFAPGPATWTVAASLASTRSTAVGVLLQSGKVLVAGGARTDQRAEVYDADSDAWSVTGNMVKLRKGAAAALLPSGQVLVAGGINGAGEVSSINGTSELYNPATNGWSTAGSLTGVRVYHSMTMLQSGKVLACGGRGADPAPPIATCEIYDPTTGDWSTTGSMATARTYQNTNLLPNGTVLVGGGWTGGKGLYAVPQDPGTATATSEIFDPDTGTWSSTGALTDARGHHTGTLLSNFQVLAAGDDSVLTAELFDSVKGSWSLTKSLPRRHDHQIATLLLNGQVLIAGGNTLDPTTNEEDSRWADLFDPGYVNPPVISTVNDSSTSPIKLAPGSSVTVVGKGFDASTGKVALVGIAQVGKSHVDTTGGQIYTPTATWTTTTAKFTLPDGAALVPGHYYLWVLANEVPSSASVVQLVETTAPTTTIHSAPRDPSNMSTATFTFVSNEAGSTFERSLDSGPYLSVKSPEDLTGLADGAHSYKVRAIDLVGNVDPNPASKSWTVDTVAPDTSIASGPSGTINSKTATFTFTSTEANSTFQYQLDGGAWTSNGASGTVTLTALAEGNHTFNVRATDPAGNVDATAATRSFTVDTVAPDTSITSGPSGTTNSATATFSFTSTEASSTFEYQLDSGVWTSNGTSGTVTLTSLAEGNHSFNVRATDSAGNVDATPATRSFTVDTVAPDTSITSGPSGTTNSATATFSFTSTEASSTFEYQLDGGAWTSNGASERVTLTVADGNHTFNVRAIDPVGNIDATPAARSWTVDTTSPDTSITSKPTDPSNSTTASFSFSATKAGSTFQYQLDGGAWTATGATLTLTAAANASHTLSVRATDSVGNTDPTPASYTWKVDTIAPGLATLLKPSNGATVLVRAVPLDWSDVSDFTGVSYELQVRTGTTVVISAQGLGSSSYTTSPLTLGSTYYWKVRAKDGAGNLGNWTSEFKFIVSRKAL